MNYLPIGIVLDVWKMLLLKSSIESTLSIVRLYGLIRNTNDYVVDLFYNYDVR